MTLKEKKHTYLQEKALNYAIEELVGPWGEYRILFGDGNHIIRFDFLEEKTKDLEDLEFTLPSLDDINALAKKKYSKFDDSKISDLIYNFDLLYQKANRYNIGGKKDLKLTVKDSNVIVSYGNFNNINIQSEGEVKIFDCSSDFDINISAKTVKVADCNRLSLGSANIISEYTEFNNVHVIRNLNIDSQLIILNNLSMTCSDNIALKADMIDCKNSELKAQEKIEIVNPNCDEIKGVYAPLIIYNGQDITYSDDIVVPKLRKNLIDVLYKLKSKVNNEVRVELESKTEIIKQELNNKPIVKMIKK